MDTKACNLTAVEIKSLIADIGRQLYDEAKLENNIERLVYLHKRLKAFSESEAEKSKIPSAAELKPKSSFSANQGWNNG